MSRASVPFEEVEAELFKNPEVKQAFDDLAEDYEKQREEINKKIERKYKMPRGKRAVTLNSIDEQITNMRVEIQRLTELKTKSDAALKMTMEFVSKLEKETEFTLKNITVVPIVKLDKD
jgi:hypothetical protein